jgi:hypothetical protein
MGHISKRRYVAKQYKIVDSKALCSLPDRSIGKMIFIKIYIHSLLGYLAIQ